MAQRVFHERLQKQVGHALPEHIGPDIPAKLETVAQPDSLDLQIALRHGDFLGHGHFMPIPGFKHRAKEIPEL